MDLYKQFDTLAMPSIAASYCFSVITMCVTIIKDDMLNRQHGLYLGCSGR